MLTARDRRPMTRRARRTTLAIASLALALLPPLAGGQGTKAAALCGSGPLEILLTNDDGYEATGIRALRSQLLAAGHRVTLVAPDHNASGSAMSFSWSAVRVTRDPQESGVFGVDATPATAVVLGVTALYPDGRRPDLVISGINHGSNAGSLLALSGTVGAALAGTLLLDPPVPGLAVNAVRLRAAEPVDSPANRAQYEAAAAHLVRLLEKLRGWYCEAGSVARPQNVLNVNYPARPVAEWRGTVVASQGSATDLRVSFAPTVSGEYRAQTSEQPVSDAPRSDNRRLEDGYVTVTPLDGRLGDESTSHRKLERRVRGL